MKSRMQKTGDSIQKTVGGNKIQKRVQQEGYIYLQLKVLELPIFTLYVFVLCSIF
jgi:hypothetical protein